MEKLSETDVIRPELLPEWWHHKFLGLGFIPDVPPDVPFLIMADHVVSRQHKSSAGRFPGTMLLLFKWYKKENFFIGIKHELRRRPSFVILNLACSRPGILKEFTFNEADEIIAVIEAVSNRKKSYLCIGIDWASDIVESCLKNNEQA